MTRPIHLAIVVSHPIQHFVHSYRSLAEREEIALKVFFCSRIGLDAYFDREMNTEIAWSMDLTSGYDHMFLCEAGRIKEVGPVRVDNQSISEKLAGFDPDAVLTYGYSSMTSLRALAWCRRRGIPSMMIGDSVLLHDRGRWKTLFKTVALPAVLRQFSCFLTTGDHKEAYYLHYGIPSGRFFRVPLTIDEPSYHAAGTDRSRLRLAFRRAHGINERALVVLYVGKLYDQKRPGDLLAATEEIRDAAKASTPLHAVYAGSGPLLADLSAQAQAKKLPITFLGFVNVVRLPEVYCGADILAHPSERDPHPLVCAEAACIGLPLVLSDRVGAVGPTDIARPDENALVYPCGDVPALADALHRLVWEPETRARMGEASKRIFDELDVRKSVEGTLAAVRYCLGNQPSRRTFRS
jgi:glycosyltransferase involved in cell wall biosynthesis